MTNPIDMVLHCPKCGKQHIDAPKPCSFGVGCQEAGVCYAEAHGKPDRCDAWNNPPHRSHLCDGCGHIWRPADVATNGVKAVKTKGKHDSLDVPENQRRIAFGDMLAMIAVRATPQELADYCRAEYDAASSITKG